MRVRINPEWVFILFFFFFSLPCIFVLLTPRELLLWWRILRAQKLILALYLLTPRSDNAISECFFYPPSKERKISKLFFFFLQQDDARRPRTIALVDLIHLSFFFFIISFLLRTRNNVVLRVADSRNVSNRPWARALRRLHAKTIVSRFFNTARTTYLLLSPSLESTEKHIALCCQGCFWNLEALRSHTTCVLRRIHATARGLISSIPNNIASRSRESRFISLGKRGRTLSRSV